MGQWKGLDTFSGCHSVRLKIIQLGFQSINGTKDLFNTNIATANVTTKPVITLKSN